MSNPNITTDSRRGRARNADRWATKALQQMLDRKRRTEAMLAELGLKPEKSLKEMAKVK